MMGRINFSKVLLSNSISSKRCLGTVAFKKYGLPSVALEFIPSKTASDAPSNGFVSVKVSASQVTIEDIRSIRGISPLNKLSQVAGTTAIGTVDTTGSDINGFTKGDFVFLTTSGTWSDSVTVNSDSVFKIPQASVEEAALIPTLTSAWAILNNFATLKPGDNVLQITANSAIGLAISAIGKDLGINIINANPNDIHSPEFLSKTKSLNIKLAISGTPGAPTSDLARHLIKNGVIVYYNNEIAPFHADETLSLSLTSLIFENKSLVGFDFSTWVKFNPANFKKGLSYVTTVLNSKKIVLKPKVYKQSEYLNAIKSVQETSALAVLKA